MPVDHFPLVENKPSRQSDRPDHFLASRNSLSRPMYNQASAARPIASKNMPQCFRENPTRKRNGQICNSSEQPSFREPNAQSQQSNRIQNSKKRSFSNDARLILAGNSNIQNQRLERKITSRSSYHNQPFNYMPNPF